MPKKRVAGNSDLTRTVDYETFVAALSLREETLSRRLRQVARYALNNPEDVAISTIVETARQAGVPTSTITRFAKQLGFEGFSELQDTFRQRLLGPKITYAQRAKSFFESPPAGRSRGQQPHEPSLIFDTFVQAAMDTLIRLREEVDRAQLNAFVNTLSKAGAVHILAARGAFGVGAYCYYSLSRVGKRAHLIDNLGSMRGQQLTAIEKNDVLLVMTFDDYTPETIEISREASRLGRTLLVITDNELSPVAKLGKHVLYVKEARLGHFRSQVPAMVLCQSIVIGVGRQAQHDKDTPAKLK